MQIRDMMVPVGDGIELEVRRIQHAEPKGPVLVFLHESLGSIAHAVERVHGVEHAHAPAQHRHPWQIALLRLLGLPGLPLLCSKKLQLAVIYNT